ncbi:hypothetical protein AAMO2058_001641100, partial [Amorphochlora amoebiformis]
MSPISSPVASLTLNSSPESRRTPSFQIRTSPNIQIRTSPKISPNDRKTTKLPQGEGVYGQVYGQEKKIRKHRRVFSESIRNTQRKVKNISNSAQSNADENKTKSSKHSQCKKHKLRVTHRMQAAERELENLPRSALEKKFAAEIDRFAHRHHLEGQSALDNLVFNLAARELKDSRNESSTAIMRRRTRRGGGIRRFSLESSPYTHGSKLKSQFQVTTRQRGSHRRSVTAGNMLQSKMAGPDFLKQLYGHVPSIKKRQMDTKSQRGVPRNSVDKKHVDAAKAFSSPTTVVEDTKETKRTSEVDTTSRACGQTALEDGRIRDVDRARTSIEAPGHSGRSNYPGKSPGRFQKYRSAHSSIIVDDEPSEFRFYRKKTRAPRDETELIERAALYVRDAFEGPHIFGRAFASAQDPFTQKLFRIKNNFWFRKLLDIVIFVHMALILFEPTCTQAKSQTEIMYIRAVDYLCTLTHLLSAAIEVLSVGVIGTLRSRRRCFILIASFF